MSKVTILPKYLLINQHILRNRFSWQYKR